MVTTDSTRSERRISHRLRSVAGRIVESDEFADNEQVFARLWAPGQINRHRGALFWGRSGAVARHALA